VSSLYANYLSEREGVSVLEIEHGFAVYQKLNNDSYYLRDIYVEPEYRSQGLATKLSDMVAEIARKDGASRLIGSVDVTKRGVTVSMKAILADGFEFVEMNGNGIYFAKKLGE
jgi:GNAT superfamily N-acetyltransferase